MLFYMTQKIVIVYRVPNEKCEVHEVKCAVDNQDQNELLYTSLALIIVYIFGYCRNNIHVTRIVDDIPKAWKVGCIFLFICIIHVYYLPPKKIFSL